MLQKVLQGSKKRWVEFDKRQYRLQQGLWEWKLFVAFYSSYLFVMWLRVDKLIALFGQD